MSSFSDSGSTEIRETHPVPPMHRLITEYASSTRYADQLHYERSALRRAYQMTLDRVNVLGNESGSYGHTGCVNALSWAFGGDVLVSGGDDRTVRLWRMSGNDPDKPYPYQCDAVLRTGHTANIFNAQFLPGTSTIATVAGDTEVRILNAERALTTTNSGRQEEFSQKECCVRILNCHKGRTKRIVTEASSDVFLTVAEDGSVRQHDLREYHRCSRATCPPALVRLPHELSTLSLSSVAPYYFVVGGESPFGYLFDRRQTGRVLQEEWGRPVSKTELVTCVRRFARPERNALERRGAEHITGSRMSQINGHEVLLTYSADSVYLFSTRDDAVSYQKARAMVNSNKKRSDSSPVQGSNSPDDGTSDDEMDDSDIAAEEESEEEHSLEEEDDEYYSQFRKTPVVLPRRKYIGACNVETVKDVNFIGPEEEMIASGSDDGNFFLWDKETGEIRGIYEGDESVVNVIESHPRLPLIAVSGIDTTVKLFAPATGHSKKSRLDQKDHIVHRNIHTVRENYDINSFILHHAMRIAQERGENASQCVYQ